MKTYIILDLFGVTIPDIKDFFKYLYKNYYSTLLKKEYFYIFLRYKFATSNNKFFYNKFIDYVISKEDLIDVLISLRSKIDYELLNFLKKEKFKIALATNFIPFKYAKYLLKPILPKFNFIFISSELTVKKPDLRFYNIIYKTLSSKKIIYCDDKFFNTLSGSSYFYSICYNSKSYIKNPFINFKNIVWVSNKKELYNKLIKVKDI